MEVKRYITKCHCCGKKIIFNVSITKYKFGAFADDIVVCDESECKCLPSNMSLVQSQILFRQLQKIYDSKNEIAKELLKGE